MPWFNPHRSWAVHEPPLRVCCSGGRRGPGCDISAHAIALCGVVAVPTRTAIPPLRSRTAPMFEWLRERSGDVVVDVALGCVIGDGDVLECAAWELWDSQAVDPWFGEDVWSAPVLD